MKKSPSMAVGVLAVLAATLWAFNEARGVDAPAAAAPGVKSTRFDTNEVPAGWKVTGAVAIDANRNHGEGASASLHVGPGGKATCKVREADAAGTAEMWVFDDGTRTEEKARRNGPLWGIVQADGKAFAVGVLYASNMSGKSYYSAEFDGTKWRSGQWLNVPRTNGWHKFTFTFDAKGSLGLLIDDKPPKSFDANKVQAKGFAGVGAWGDEGKDSAQMIWLDDVTVGAGSAAATKPASSASPSSAPSPSPAAAQIKPAALPVVGPGIPAVADKTLPEAPFYGVKTWGNCYVKHAEDVRKVGLKWIVVDGWMKTEQAEETALTAARNGVDMLVQLPTARDAFRGDLDEAMKKYRRFVRDNVLKYGPGGTFWKAHPEVPARSVRYWSEWEEGEIGYLNPPEGVSRVDLGARILQACSEEIRKVDPGARIIAFNTSEGAAISQPSMDNYMPDRQWYGWRRYIREVSAQIDPNIYDGIGMHNFHIPLGPETAGVIKGLELLREAGRPLGFADKGVWYTAGGYPFVYPRGNQVRDERQQACFMARMLAISAAHGVVQYAPDFIEDFLDTDAINAGMKQDKTFGLFPKPGVWREQAFAIRTMIRLLPDPRKDCKVLCEEKELCKDGVFAYQWKGAGGCPVLMAWWTGKDDIPQVKKDALKQKGYQLDAWKGGPESVEREFAVEGKEATLVDMLGKDIRPAEIKDGKVKLTLGEAPVYVVSAPKADVEKLLADK